MITKTLLRFKAITVTFLISFILLILLVPAKPAHAATLTVTNLNDSGSGSLRQTIEGATAGDTIVFQSGLTGTILFESVIEIDKDITIDGPGSNVIELNGNDAVQLLYLTNEDATLSVNDLSFTHSSGFGAIRTEGGLGGALYVDNSVFSNNYNGAGGTIRSGSAVTTITNSTFTQNSSIRGPGAIGASGTVTITNNLFQDNSAAWFGGGISVQGDVLVENNTFVNNLAGTYDGGAIYVGSTENPDVKIRNNTFTGNHAGGTGGAISGTFTISLTGNTFNDNSANNGGAFGYDLSHCDFQGNYPLQLANNTFHNNIAAENGGAIYYSVRAQPGCPRPPELIVEHSFTLKNNTIEGNVAISGGATYFTEENGEQPWNIISTNNIFASNSGNNCAGLLRTGIDDQGNNLQFPGTSCGETITVGDPLLMALANNGGPTKTMMPQAGSPVLDGGNNAICAASPINNLDQRGMPRPIDDNGDSVAFCDIGATEGIATNINSAPVVSDITFTNQLVAINTAAAATASFTDVDVTDTHTALWDWGDTATSNGTVTESNGSGTVAGSHTYTTPGVYTVSLTVTDNNVASDTKQFMYVVVYDPNGGFVTGSGRYDMPAGSIPAAPTESGMTNFGTNAKYVNNVLTGSTRLMFRDGQYVFNFDSTTYDWLVVTNGNQAQLHGTGKINGSGNYTFTLTALDNAPDTVRIQIWDGATVMYDNATSILTNGNIQVHN